jgi:hypothetical protein
MIDASGMLAELMKAAQQSQKPVSVQGFPKGKCVGAEFYGTYGMRSDNSPIIIAASSISCYN